MTKFMKNTVKRDCVVKKTVCKMLNPLFDFVTHVSSVIFVWTLGKGRCSNLIFKNLFTIFIFPRTTIQEGRVTSKEITDTYPVLGSSFKSYSVPFSISLRFRLLTSICAYEVQVQFPTHLVRTYKPTSGNDSCLTLEV